MNGLGKLLDFLSNLETNQVRYALAHARRDSLTVCVTLPGERWEVEFYVDGRVQIEKFQSSGTSDEGELEKAVGW